MVPSGESSDEQASRRWPVRARARRAHALLPTGSRLKTVATAVGWAAQCWDADGLPGKLGGFPSYSIFLLFSIFLLLFWL